MIVSPFNDRNFYLTLSLGSIILGFYSDIFICVFDGKVALLYTDMHVLTCPKPTCKLIYLAFPEGNVFSYINTINPD